ncbi:DUF1727 domain-containing protein [Thermoleophilia bacterium SCSIO 60948]|nr:DUF1727 domain-containing protein [Thermoleophilia bacterium SCSIO 60948]
MSRASDATFAAKLALARATGEVSRRTGRGGGTTLPGRMLLRLEPDALSRMRSRLPEGSTLISATNGKTTTAGMIASCLEAAGRHPVHNRAGSNMSWGIATALLAGSGREGLFEVDEAWLPRVAAELRPRTITLANLFRDQLDRYGELERLADDWARVVTARSGSSQFVLNADDPLVADLGRDRDLRRRPGVAFFGIDDVSQALPELQHAHDAKHCRRCGAPYVYERAFVGHLGHYSCSRCEARRPDPDVVATRIELRGMGGSTVTVRTPGETVTFEVPLPGLYNVYNALAALATALYDGVSLRNAVAGIERTKAVFGRVETIDVAGTPVSILLIKNPAGANEVIRTIGLEAARGGPDSENATVWIALNDRIADGRDVSWIWDADFELLAGGVDRVVCAGTRAPELALRLRYAGIDADRIETIGSVADSLDHAVGLAGERLFALPTYTALLELRTLLARRGLAKDYWA